MESKKIYKVVCYACNRVTPVKLEKKAGATLMQCHRMWALTRYDSDEIAQRHLLPGVMLLVLATDPLKILENEWNEYAREHGYPECTDLQEGKLPMSLYNPHKFNQDWDNFFHLH